MSTRGISTATLEKAKAKAKKLEAEQQLSLASGLNGEIDLDDDKDLLPDEHMDELPFDDEETIEKQYAHSQTMLSTLDASVESTVADARAKLAAYKEKFRSTLAKHVATMEARGLTSKLTDKPRPMAHNHTFNESKTANNQLHAATTTTTTRNKEEPKRNVAKLKMRPDDVLNPSATAASAPDSPHHTGASSSRFHLSQTTRLSSSSSIVPPLSFASPASSPDRPATARPASASRNTPRQRLEQARLFSESVYGSKPSTSSSSTSSAFSPFDIQPLRDEMTGAILPGALSKVRATSAPYRPQHSKPSFIQPNHPLSPIQPSNIVTAPLTPHQQQPTFVTDEQRPSSSASNTSAAALNSDRSVASTTSNSSAASSQVGSSTPKTKIAKKKISSTSSTHAPSIAPSSSSSSSSLFASPFADLRPVPVLTPSQAKAIAAKKESAVHNRTATAVTATSNGSISTNNAPATSNLAAATLAGPSTSPSSSTTSTSSASGRSAEAIEASQRKAAILAATKAALTSAKGAPSATEFIAKSETPTGQPSLTKGVLINPKMSKRTSSASASATSTTPTHSQINLAPTVTQQTLHSHSALVGSRPQSQQQQQQQQQQRKISANQSDVPTAVTAVSTPPQPLQHRPELSQGQLVRQQLLAAQLAHAKAQKPEEIDLDSLDDQDDDDDTDDSNGLEGLTDHAADEDDGSSLFARPWSAHARSHHSALNSARSRPQSAARHRIEDHIIDEQPYASFSIPIHNHTDKHSNDLQTQLHSHINVSSVYAKAFQIQKHQQQTRTDIGNNPVTVVHSIAHGGTTPRGNLPVTHNPFLLKTTVFSGKK